MNISEMGKGEKKKSNSSTNLLKKLEKYLSMKKVSGAILSKSKSWHGRSTTTIAPEGCFWVYVGPDKERFVIKTKYANHPLFKKLLEDAVKEYGYSYSQGPILLPCDVDIFYKVLAEMGSSNKEIDDPVMCGSCSPLFSPGRRLGNSRMAKGYGSYGILTPPRLFKRLNSFNYIP